MGGVEMQKPVSLVFLEELLLSETVSTVHIKSAVSASARLYDDAQQIIELIESGSKEAHLIKSTKRYTQRYLVDALRCVSHLRCIAERQITPAVGREDRKSLRQAKTNLLVAFDRLLLGKPPAASRSSSASASSASSSESLLNSPQYNNNNPQVPHTNTNTTSSGTKPKAATTVSAPHSTQQGQSVSSIAQTSNVDTNAIALCSVDEWSLTSYDKRNRLIIKGSAGGNAAAGRYSRQQRRLAALASSDSDTDSLKSLLDSDKRYGGGYLHFLLEDEDEDDDNETSDTETTSTPNPLLVDSQRRRLLQQREQAQKGRQQSPAKSKEKHKHGRGGSPTPSLRACLDKNPHNMVMRRSDVRRAGWWFSVISFVLLCVVIASVVGVYEAEQQHFIKVANKYAYFIGTYEAYEAVMHPTTELILPLRTATIDDALSLLSTNAKEGRPSIAVWLTVVVILGLLVVLLMLEAVPPLITATVSTTRARNAWRTALLSLLSGILVALISCGAYGVMIAKQTYLWNRIRTVCVLLDTHSHKAFDPAVIERVIWNKNSITVIVVCAIASAVFVAVFILVSPLRYGIPYGPVTSLLASSRVKLGTLRALFVIKMLSLTLVCCILIASLNTVLTNMELQLLATTYINVNLEGIVNSDGAWESLFPNDLTVYESANIPFYWTPIIFYIQSTAICIALAAWIVSIPPFKLAHWRLSAVASAKSTQRALLRYQATPKLAMWAALCCLAVVIPSCSPLILGGVSRGITHHTIHMFSAANLRLLSVKVATSTETIPSNVSCQVARNALAAEATSLASTTAIMIASILHTQQQQQQQQQQREVMVQADCEEGDACLQYAMAAEGVTSGVSSSLTIGAPLSDAEIDVSVQRVWWSVMRTSACACAALLILSWLDVWWLVGLLHLRACWAAENPKARGAYSAVVSSESGASFDMTPTLSAAVVSVNASLQRQQLLHQQQQQEREQQQAPAVPTAARRSGVTRNTFSNTAAVEGGLGAMKSVQRMVITAPSPAADPRQSWTPMAGSPTNRDAPAAHRGMDNALIELKGKLDVLPRLSPQSTRVLHLVLMFFMIPVMVFYAVPSVYFATKLAGLPGVLDGTVSPGVESASKAQGSSATSIARILLGDTAAATALEAPSSEEQFALVYSSAFMAKQDRSLEHLELIRSALQDRAGSEPAAPRSAFVDALRLVALAGDALRKLFVVDHIAAATYLNFRAARMPERERAVDGEEEEEDRLWSQLFSNATSPHADPKDVRHSVRSAALDAFLDSLAYIRELWDVLPLVLPMQQPAVLGGGSGSSGGGSNATDAASKPHWVDALTSVQSSLKSAVATMSTEADPQADRLWHLQTDRVRTASAASSTLRTVAPAQLMRSESESTVACATLQSGIDNRSAASSVDKLSLYAKSLKALSINEAQFGTTLLLVCFCVLTAACVFSWTFMDLVTTRSYLNDLRGTPPAVPTDPLTRTPREDAQLASPDGRAEVAPLLGNSRARDGGGGGGAGASARLQAGQTPEEQRQRQQEPASQGADGAAAAALSGSFAIRKAIVDQQWREHLRVIVLGDIVMLMTLVIAGIIFWLVNHSARVVHAALASQSVGTGFPLLFQVHKEESQAMDVNGASSLVTGQDPATIATAVAVKEVSARLFGAAMDAVRLLESDPSAVTPCALTVPDTAMAAYVEAYFSALRSSAGLGGESERDDDEAGEDAEGSQQQSGPLMNATAARAPGTLMNATLHVKQWWAPAQAALNVWHLLVATNTGTAGGDRTDRAKAESAVAALIERHGNFEDLLRSSPALASAFPTDALQSELDVAFAEVAAMMSPHPSAGIAHFTAPARLSSASSSGNSRYTQWLQLAAEASALSIPPQLQLARTSATEGADLSHVDRIAIDVDAGNHLDSGMTDVARTQSDLADPHYIALVVQWCSIVLMWIVFLSAMILLYGLRII